MIRVFVLGSDVWLSNEHFWKCGIDSLSYFTHKNILLIWKSHYCTSLCRQKFLQSFTVNCYTHCISCFSNTDCFFTNVILGWCRGTNDHLPNTHTPTHPQAIRHKTEQTPSHYTIRIGPYFLQMFLTNVILGWCRGTNDLYQTHTHPQAIRHKTEQTPSHIVGKIVFPVTQHHANH